MMTLMRERSCVIHRMQIAAAAAAMAIMAMVMSAEAAQRMISVNGQWLTPKQIRMADACAGFALPDGYYWVHPGTGYWGVVGGTPVGRLPRACRSGTGGSHGDGQTWISSGLGDPIGLDGACAYDMDPETGASVMTGTC